MTVQLTVAPAAAEDAGRGMARIDPATLSTLGGATGALLAITGGRTAYARALPQRPTLRAEAVLHIDLAPRANAKAMTGDPVTVALAGSAAAALEMRLTAPVGI